MLLTRKDLTTSLTVLLFLKQLNHPYFFSVAFYYNKNPGNCFGNANFKTPGNTITRSSRKHDYLYLLY